MSYYRLVILYGNAVTYKLTMTHPACIRIVVYLDEPPVCLKNLTKSSRVACGNSTVNAANRSGFTSSLGSPPISLPMAIPRRGLDCRGMRSGAGGNAPCDTGGDLTRKGRPAPGGAVEYKKLK